MKQEEYMPEKPGQVKISLTNLCNYRCVMCPNSTFKQPRGFMDDELAFRIVDDCVASGIKKLSLGSSGEPLLHKGFVRYLRYAKERGFWVSTATNCSLLTPKLTDEIMSVGIDRVNLSVYSATPEEHKRYCGNNKFDDVVRNVTYFLEHWAAGGRVAEVNMGFLSIPGVNDEAAFMRFWGPITQRCGLKIDRRDAVNWAGSMDTFKDSVVQRRWGVSRDRGQLVVRFSKVVPCTQMPSYVYILHDGTVLPCCFFPDSTDHPEMQFGNVRESSIVAVWQSPRFRRFRENHFRCEVKGYAPCIACEARFRLFEIRPWATLRRLFTGPKTRAAT